MANNIAPVTEDQVSHIIAVITIAIIVSEEQLKKKTDEVFGEVNTHLNSLIDAFLNRVFEVSVS